MNDKPIMSLLITGYATVFTYIDKGSILFLNKKDYF